METINRFAIFQKNYSRKTVVMGRKTWDSLPFPLPGRRNIVISRSNRDDVEVMSIEEVRRLAKTDDCSSSEVEKFILYLSKNQVSYTEQSSIQR